MGKRVLVIEDDGIIGPKLMKELIKAGHEVDLATYFKKAEALLRDEAKTFDVVVCDQNFPMFGETPNNPRPLGIDLIRQVRRCDIRYKDILFILHTGEDGDDIKERCTQLNVQYCFKQYGISFSKLLELLNECP